MISNVKPGWVQEASLLQIDCHVIIYNYKVFNTRYDTQKEIQFAAVSKLRQLTLRACAKYQCKWWGRGVLNPVVERDTTIKVLRFSLVDDKLIF